MKNLFEKYIASISTKFSHKETTEMGYRADFEALISGIFEKVVTLPRVDHDAKAQQGNKPDFVVMNIDVPIMYVEAKDIGVSLDKVEKSEQMARYYGYTNLVLTDYLEFRFYRNGKRYEEPIKIGNYDIKSRLITPLPENFGHLEASLTDFANTQKEPIKSGKHLSQIMGGKAQRIRDNIRQFLSIESEKNEEVLKIFETIKRMLVHDLTIDTFADMYAQTLVYGLFVARYYDETPDTFSRQEARELIPATNPFLQHFFDHICGPDFDRRLKYIVDELCTVFEHANVKKLMEDYMEGADPVIHFYEDFLKEYDPNLRKKMGAYYTPLPVVNFIIRSVDKILQRDFGLQQGFADTSKLLDGKHKVQVLDPATGTGTFISATIRSIYEKLKSQNQLGRWPAYVHNDLLPRMHGFELMMAPYTIAHLRLGLAFKKTGFSVFHKRLGIYLTNSLELGVKQEDMFAGFGFAESIANESKEASKIKNETPIMVVIGNPPYSISSSNKGEWILDLIKDYKKGLGERKINLDDDYIKFIRFSENFIEKNKTGVVAMITNNSFIDGITHRQMRKHLLETFDDIYVLDLHGNSKKKEKTPDGGKDENVFDIQQGVSINIFVRKTENKKDLGYVYHTEIYGLREDKFEFLDKNKIESIKWNKLDYKEPYYFFVPKDFRANKEYEKGFSVIEIFIENNSGIQTKRDNVVVSISKEEAHKISNDFLNLTNVELENKYKSGEVWTIEQAKRDILKGFVEQEILYRPFDIRNTLYTGRSGGFMARPREKINKHIVDKDNLTLITCRNQTFETTALVTDKISDLRTYSNPGSLGTDYVFPLYLYSDDGSKTSNLKKEIVSEIEKTVGKVTPENILDYIYAVLYSPNYRERYKEFLKIDFPRVPYPKNKKQFFELAKIGEELRKLHLLESEKLSRFITSYSESGDDIVEKVSYRGGKVYINPIQYFGGVPENVWNFYIGGYQPAQKWLKDRKGRKLANEDIEHYQKIIVALSETDRIMREIDRVWAEKLICLS